MRTFARHAFGASRRRMCSSRSCCSSTGARRLGQQVLAALRLRERDHVADRLRARPSARPCGRGRTRCRRAAARRTAARRAGSRTSPRLLRRRCRARGIPSPAPRRGGSAPSRRRSPSRSARCRRPSRSALPGVGLEQALVAVLRAGERMVHRAQRLSPRRTRTSGSRPPTAAASRSRRGRFSWPTFARSAPSASFTTLAWSAPKKMTSPSCAPVRSRIAPSASGGQELHDRRLQPFLVRLRRVVHLDVGEALGAVDRDELARRSSISLRVSSAAAAGHAQRRHASVLERGGRPGTP